MINVFSEVFLRKNIIVRGYFTTKVLLNLNPVIRKPENFKLLFTSSVNQQQNPYNEYRNHKKELPNLFYIQNPVTWLINKIDFIMLKNAWDPDFVEKDFKRGVKQAVSVICTLISKNLWTNLRGLITSKTLSRLQRDVEVNWKEDQIKSIAIEPSDIKLVLPRKVHFLRISDQKFVDVDVICVAMKYKDQIVVHETSDVVLIEILARFHRNYTIGQLPNWTVTLFKVSSQNFKNKL